VKTYLSRRLVAELSGRLGNGFRIHAESTLRRSACRLASGAAVASWSSLSAYDEDVKQIPCVCGYAVKGEDDDELWQNAQKHLREDHPDLVGRVSRADLLAQAEEVPKPRS
jgi:hypothetical protein